MNRLFRQLLTLRRMEYLILNQDLVISETSSGVKRFADCPDEVVEGKNVCLSFPELIGSEACLKAVLQGQQLSLEFKAITRLSASGTPLYFDLFAIKSDEDSEKSQLNIFFEDVTEKMVLEQSLVQATNETALLLSALETSRNYIEKVIVSIADALIVTNQSGKIKRVNQAAQNLFQYSKEEIVKQSISNIVPDETFLSRTRQYALKEDCFKNIEVICKTKTGTKVDVAFSCSAIQTDTEDLYDFVYIGRDITEQKRSQRLQAAQYATTRVLSESLTLKQASQTLLPALCEALGWDLSELWLVDEEERDGRGGEGESGRGGEWESGRKIFNSYQSPVPSPQLQKLLRCVEVWHRASADIPEFLSRTWRTPLECGVGLPGYIWQMGSPYWVSDGIENADSPEIEFAAQAGMHSSIGFPILVDGEVRGVMTFFSCEVQPPDADLLQMMAGIGSQIGQFIQRKQAEAALQKITQLQQAILDSANFSIISTDQNGTILTFNLAAQQWLGYTAQEVVGKTTPMLFHDSAEVALQTEIVSKELGTPLEPGFEVIVAKARQNIPEEKEWTYISKNGSRFPMRLSVTVLQDATGVQGFLGIGRNLSEYRQTIQALRQREQLLDLAGDSIVIRDVNDNIIYWNQGAERLYGWTKQEVLGQHAHLRLQTIFPQPLAEIQQLFLQDGFWQGELLHKRRDGTQIIVASRWTLQRNSDGSSSACLEINTDITEQKRMRTALQESEERYRDLFENANDLIHSVAPNGRFVYVNRAWRETLGYSEAEVANLRVFDIIHPDSKSKYINFFQQVKAGEKIDDCYAEFITKSGEKIAVEGSISCRFINGKPVATRAIFRDITQRLEAEAERQRAEQELRESETLIRALYEVTTNLKLSFYQRLQELLALGCQYFDLEFGMVARLKGDVCEAIAVQSPDDSLKVGDIYDIQQTFCLEALKAEQPFCVYNASNSEWATHPGYTVFGREIYIGSPILVTGKAYGILCFSSRTVSPRQFRSVDKELLNLMTQWIGGEIERKMAEEALAQQQEQTERLLLNILPEPIAERLKQQEKTIAENFNEVTVLFADIVGFTELSSRTSPTELVEMLNVIFSDFDQLAELHGLEKIKTIGDAYMVVGGLPKPQLNHAEAIADMALDMQASIAQYSRTMGETLSIRIGINTGSVVAGVIGKKKFIYDLWGDTVNIASRMESHGLPGLIQVTTQTYERLQDQYKFEQRGIIQVKGRGEMMTYFLVDRKGKNIPI